MTLIDEIRSDLTNESASLANTLRKAKILASNLGVSEFEEWVDSELNGYPNRSKVPDYRRSLTHNIGTFSGPFQSGVKNVTLPTSFLPEPVKSFAEHLVFTEGVGELDEMLKGGEEGFKSTWPREYVIMAKDSTKMTNGMVLVDAYQPILPTHVAGVLDKIKNILLGFVLSLQNNNVTLENIERGKVNRDVVRNLVNINIYGDHNIVAGGENIQQQANPIQKGDIASLMGYLNKHKVGRKSRSKLRKALLNEPDASSRALGPKVKAWVRDMKDKASSGIWKVGLAEASKVLMDGLRGYYGN